MKLVTIDSKKQLDDFVGTEKHSQFIQSWAWSEFQRLVSGTVWRIGVEDKGKLIASAKISKKDLPMGRSYFYCGRGPVFKGDVWNVEAAALIFAEIERLAEEEMVMFLRFDPSFDCIADVEQIIGNRTFIKSDDVQPSKTLILDVTKTEEELLAAMHQKTRYNINLANKKEVKIVEGGKERFEDFWSLLDQTTGRDKFRPHGRSHYSAMFDIETDTLKLLFAEVDGKPLAASILLFFGDTATYLHGGSSNDDRNLMAPYALQWASIQMAKNKGMNYYDFYGIDEERWPGVTRFKMGFGGEVKVFPGTYDIIYDEGWYSVYRMVRKVRRSF
ncbi:MAG: peptidoglycan bridge formation glycyltransferase FemA/FemB family protein [bacterium]